MTGPGLRERKKQKTRWAIQEHALRLFAQQGYDATTVDQIAAAAEISPSTFFRYFKTKEDVVLEDEYDPILFDAFVEAPAELGPVAALRHAIKASLGSLSQADMRKIIDRGRLQLTEPSLRARSMEDFLGTRDLIGEAVAQRTGRQPDDQDVRSFAGAVMGVLLAALMDWFEKDATDGLAEEIDKALAHLENGLPL